MAIVRNFVLGDVKVPDRLVEPENRVELELKLIELAAKTIPEEPWYRTFTESFARGASETARGIQQLMDEGDYQQAYEKEFMARVYAAQNPKSDFSGYLTGSLGDVPSYLFGGFARKGAGFFEEVLTKAGSIGTASGLIAPVYEEFGDSRTKNAVVGAATTVAVMAPIAALLRKYGAKSEAELEEIVKKMNPDQRAQAELDIQSAYATIRRNQEEANARVLAQNEQAAAANRAIQGDVPIRGASETFTTPAFRIDTPPTAPRLADEVPRAPMTEEQALAQARIREEAMLPTEPVDIARERADTARDIGVARQQLEAKVTAARSAPPVEAIDNQLNYLNNQMRMLDAQYVRRMGEGIGETRTGTKGLAQRISDSNDRILEIQKRREEVRKAIEELQAQKQVIRDANIARAQLSRLPLEAAPTDVSVLPPIEHLNMPVGEMRINTPPAPAPTQAPVPTPTPAAPIGVKPMQSPLNTLETPPPMSPAVQQSQQAVAKAAPIASPIQRLFNPNFQRSANDASVGARQVNPLGLDSGAARAATMNVNSAAAQALPNSRRMSQGEALDSGLSDAERVRINSIRESSKDLQQMLSTDGYAINQRMSMDQLLQDSDNLADAVIDEIGEGNYRHAGEWLLEQINPRGGDVRILSSREKVVAARIRAVAMNRLANLMTAYRSQILAGGKDTKTSIRIMSEMQVDKELMEAMDEMANVVTMADIDASNTGRALQALRLANAQYKETMNRLATGRTIDELFFNAGKC